MTALDVWWQDKEYLSSIRQWWLAAEDRGPFAMSQGYNRIKFAYCYNLASWFYFMGNNLAKELVFKP